MIQRFSSRRQRFDKGFLEEHLKKAQAYDRIAGYFSSSLLEVAGEALESVEGRIRVVCNSDLDVRDVETARAAQMAVRRAWCASRPEKFLEGPGEKGFVSVSNAFLIFFKMADCRSGCFRTQLSG